MDPIEKINITGDSTFALMLEAQSRGHTLFYYTPDTLAMQDGVVRALVSAVTVRDVKGDHVTIEPAIRHDLSTMDVILLRQDPPFDMAYITTTH
jgi:glutathione synthase